MKNVAQINAIAIVHEMASKFPLLPLHVLFQLEINYPQ